MIRRPPRSTLDRSSAASDVYKRQIGNYAIIGGLVPIHQFTKIGAHVMIGGGFRTVKDVPPLSLIHISEPTRPY